MQESTSLLDEAALEALRGRKNLLAFSAGVDSSALFFLLLDAGIEFDIAIVNYNTRVFSNEEALYAKELAQKYGKECFVKSVRLDSSNFEAEARGVRYAFFEEIIGFGNYENLITAHQLNDRLEWFFMRLSKGAGIRELIGGKTVEKRGVYTLVKPLLNISKKNIYEYLQRNKIKYYEDESNIDAKYERNFFRSEFASAFMERFEDGVRRSFEILSSEAALFEVPFLQKNELIIFKRVSGLIDESNISLALKKIGYLASANQRKEIKNKDFDAVVGGRFCVCKSERLIFVAPHIRAVMPKEFKEKCRIAGIPPKIRGYLFAKEIDVNMLEKELATFSAL
ncbi:MAG: tRNA lysidine(34) synthetase TilS [Campylobacteraceae bacterium]|nr:tRNA lysidine(34) synthetase TilS [Campylobacteraceae bacterium]